MSRNPARVVPVLLVASVVVACGGSGSSLFGSSGGGSSGAPGSSSGADPGSFSNDPVGTNAACVTAMKNAVLPAVNLVIMYDKSGSMGDPPEGGDPNLKWIPVNTGMKAFFADPQSASYNASLQFFPAPGDVATTCSADYATPAVPLTSLSNGAALAAALDAAQPHGGTPTLPALRGAITYATQLTKTQGDDTSVVVLVTDGEPGIFINGQMVPGCQDNDIQHVAAAAQTAQTQSPPVKTYVIGVGPSLDNLNQIAAAGGTGQAFMIPVADPTQTKTELQKAFDSIRSQVRLPCAFSIPPPPPGEKVDTNRVNVAYTSGAGQETPLVYSADCASGSGWRYDNPAAPTRIELCPAMCATAQGDKGGRVTVAFGCVTNSTQK